MQTSITLQVLSSKFQFWCNKLIHEHLLEHWISLYKLNLHSFWFQDFIILIEKSAFCHMAYFLCDSMGLCQLQQLCPVFHLKFIHCLLVLTSFLIKKKSHLKIYFKKFSFEILSAETTSTYVENIHPLGSFWQVEYREGEILRLWKINHLHKQKWKIRVKAVVIKRNMSILKPSSTF